jgi:hypothetical protein
MQLHVHLVRISSSRNRYSFSAEPLYCDINRVSVAAKIHVPDLRGNQGAGRTSPDMDEEFQQAELFTAGTRIPGAADFSGWAIN